MKVSSKMVKGIIKATFPDYKRRDVVIDAKGKVTFYDLNWSGGTRNEYMACTVDGKPIESRYDMSSPAPWNNPFEGKAIEIPRGAVVVQSGYFCGKVSMMHIYCNPEDMPKWIEAPKTVSDIVNYNEDDENWKATHRQGEFSVY